MLPIYTLYHFQTLLAEQCNSAFPLLQLFHSPSHSGVVIMRTTRLLVIRGSEILHMPMILIDNTAVTSVHFMFWLRCTTRSFDCTLPCI